MDRDDYDYDDLGVRSVDLEYADKGYRLCDECQGQGTYMYYACYGGNPEEVNDYCQVCRGEGQVEIEAVASISRNKREGHYAGKWARGAWYGGDPVKHHRSHSVELMLRTHRKGVFSGFREP